MKIKLGALLCVICVTFLIGCGNGGTAPGGGGGSTPANSTLYFAVGFNDTHGLFHYDKTNPTGQDAVGNGVYTNNAAFIYQTYNNQTSFGLLGSGGNYYLTINAVPSSSNPILIEFAVPFAGDAECPVSLNGQAAWVNESYTSNYQSKTYNCAAAYPYTVNPLSVDPNNPISFVSMGVPNPVDTTYGLPSVSYYGTAGNFLGSEAAASVSPDGLTITIPTDLIMSFANGDILVAVSQVNPDLSLSPQGGGVLSIFASLPPDPGFPGDPGGGGGCYSNNCILQDNPN